MNEKKKILVIGSANTDLIIHADRVPCLGETITGSGFAVNAGGKGLNQAVAIAKLGGNISFLGAVGDDANGRMLLDTIGQFGIDFVGITDGQRPTGTAMITVVNGDNFIILDAGANDTLTPGVINSHRQLIQDADFVVLQLEIPTETIAEICKAAKDSGTKVVLNPAPYKALPTELYPMIDYLIPNEHEAKDITGIDPDSDTACIDAVNQLMDLGVGNVVITLGARGCVYTHRGQILFADAAEADVVDTTSAGDSFIGALVTQLAENRPMSDAIGYASKVAAITVSRHGAAKSIPFADEIK